MREMYHKAFPKEQSGDVARSRKKEHMIFRHLVRYAHYQKMKLEDVASTEAKITGKCVSHDSILNSVRRVEKMIGSPYLR